ncbi:MAG: HD domain-containing protein [Solirubrobacteraceae bacterium]
MAGVVAHETVSELVWAERTARGLLEPLGARWEHTLGVAARAQSLGSLFDRRDADLLVAAALVHDVGYAPALGQTGLHALDGALFLRAHGRERLAGLVAFHSGARFEARERGLSSELEVFADERSVVSAALSYCDLTTGPGGEAVGVSARLAGVNERWGADAPQSRAIEHARESLVEDVRRIEAMIEARDSPEPATDRGTRQ